MALPKKGHCSNRMVVNADNRLHSPYYDWNMEEGLAWNEFFDSDAMCFFGLCSHTSYNAWAKATDDYINGTTGLQLFGHYKEVLGRAKAKFGGAAFPIELSDKFNDVIKLMNEWKDSGIRPNKTWTDDYRLPRYWAGEIRGIIEYFDRAACLYDDLDSIAANILDQPSLVRGAPVQKLEEVPGGYLGGKGGGSGSGGILGKSSNLGLAVGVMAIGAAGYFGFKVLTE